MVKWCYTVLSIEFLLLCYGHEISKIFIYYPLNIKLFSFICIFVWLGPLLSGTLGRWIHLNIDIKRLFAETKHVLFLWEWIRLWTSKWWHMYQIITTHLSPAIHESDLFCHHFLLADRRSCVCYYWNWKLFIRLGLKISKIVSFVL